MMEPIVNKIEASGLITLDPVTFLPADPLLVFDLKPFLFKALILKEKDFREALKNHDWERYRGESVAVYCSTDAIIPMWAYMLVTTYLEPVARDIRFGDQTAASAQIALSAIDKMDLESYRNQRVVIKGCGDRPIPAEVYVALMKKLQPVVKSLMFGEACSTVPVYKQKKSS